MTAKKIKSLSDDALAWTMRDLREAIDNQEAMARAGYHCPKLGEYWDDLHGCIAERNRRAKKSDMTYDEWTAQHRARRVGVA